MKKHVIERRTLRLAVATIKQLTAGSGGGILYPTILCTTICTQEPACSPPHRRTPITVAMMMQCPDTRG